MKKVKFKVDIINYDLEYLFNEMINDGYSVEEAINSIITDELIDQKLYNEYPEYIPDSITYDEDGNVEAELELIDNL
jgi:hypothetical protein